MLESFKSRAEAVSAEVHRFPGSAEALGFVLDLLRKEGVADAPGSYAVWAGGTLLDGVDRIALARELPGLRFDVTRETAAAARIGVSQMDWGVANTGTLAQAADDVGQRLASMLPLLHVALLRTDRMVPDLAGLFARLSPSQTRYLALVTGPSRTADIERVLTIGVHGPARLVILLVDDLRVRN